MPNLLTRLLPWLARALFLIALAGPARAEVQERFALVVGNGTYRFVPPLPNPVADARDFAALVREARFDVTFAQDTDLESLRRAVAAFGEKVGKAGPDALALVYYAGHGIQENGQNYLVPVDAKFGEGAEVKDRALSLAEVFRILDATKVRSRIVILDACRDNPFAPPSSALPRGLAAAGPVVEDGERGVTRLDTRIGTLVAFATSPGDAASDGAGGHSPYTAALLSLMRQPGLAVEEVFKRARLAVNKATAGDQTPWESSSLTVDFAFFPEDDKAGAARAEAGPGSLGARARQAAKAPLTREVLVELGPREAYDLVVYAGRIDVYRLYVEVFPAELRSLSIHRLLARQIEELAWVLAVRDGSQEALADFARLFPTSLHQAEAFRLLVDAARRETLTTASVCPLPTPAVPSPAPRRGRRADLAVPAPPPAPALAPPSRAAKPAPDSPPPSPPPPREGGGPVAGNDAPPPVAIPPRPPLIPPLVVREPPVVIPPVVERAPPVVIPPVGIPPVVIRLPEPPKRPRPRPEEPGTRPGGEGQTPPCPGRLCGKIPGPVVTPNPGSPGPVVPTTPTCRGRLCGKPTGPAGTPPKILTGIPKRAVEVLKPRAPIEIVRKAPPALTRNPSVDATGSIPKRAILKPFGRGFGRPLVERPAPALAVRPPPRLAPPLVRRGPVFAPRAAGFGMQPRFGTGPRFGHRPAFGMGGHRPGFGMGGHRPAFGMGGHRPAMALGGFGRGGFGGGGGFGRPSFGMGGRGFGGGGFGGFRR